MSLELIFLCSICLGYFLLHHKTMVAHMEKTYTFSINNSMSIEKLNPDFPFSECLFTINRTSFSYSNDFR